MNPFTMAELLLGDMTLTPSQLAQLRAINTKYFTELYALQHPATGRADSAMAEPLADRLPVVPEADLVALDEVIARDIREILTDEQRAVLDRNWAKVGAVGNRKAR